jgi:DNA-binding SARP family transcriptional activator
MGPPQVLLGDVPLTFGRHKAMALLIYLAISGGIFSRDTLAELLSDGATDEEAKSQLRTTLRELRRQLDPYLEVTRNTIALTRGCPLWLDVIELESRAIDEGQPGAIEDLTYAVSLYQGPFLAGFVLRGAPEFDTWLIRERERVHTLLVEVLKRLVATASGQGAVPSSGRAMA